jgi:pilus assembly protein CpaB
MDFRKVALLVGALVIAITTAVIARGMFAGSGAPSAEAKAEQGVAVLIAKQTLPIGTMIEPAMIAFQPWPKDMVDAAYMVQGSVDPAALKGQVVRYAVAAGQPISSGALIKPGDRGFLAAALGPGMRAVTVNVNASSGVAGFIFPGDRVDVVLTQEVAGGGKGDPLKVSETIIRNIRVLATDQRSSSEPAEGEAAADTVRIVSTVTLESTPKIAEKIAVAQSVGQLSLSLRSIADNAAELEAAIASGEVSIPEGTDETGEKRILLALASQPIDAKGSFSTGGDVSRFQRTSVPGEASAEDDPAVREARRVQAQIALREARKQLAESGGGTGITVRRGSDTTKASPSGTPIGGR